MLKLVESRKIVMSSSLVLFLLSFMLGVISFLVEIRFGKALKSPTSGMLDIYNLAQKCTACTTTKAKL